MDTKDDVPAPKHAARSLILIIFRIFFTVFYDIFDYLQAIGGARDVKCMFWDVSLLDAQEVSIIYRNDHSFPL